jgi:signal transduction histidine kinase
MNGIFMELERIEETMKEKELVSLFELFTREAVHELLNPLQVLGGSIYLFEKHLQHTSDPKVTSQIQSCKRQVEALNRIVSNIAVLIKNRKLLPQRWSLNTLIQQILSMTTLPANIRIHLNLSPDIDSTIFDPEAMSHAITNLIIEACKAMPSGGDLTIETALTDDESVEIRMTDTGHAISEEMKSNLFEIRKNPKARGGGLGMAVIKKVITQHQGTIDVRSNPEQGTTFTIRLENDPLLSQENSEDLNQSELNPIFAY